MVKMFKLIVILCLCGFVHASRLKTKGVDPPPYGGLYARIQKGEVQDAIAYFLNDNSISNCFGQRVHKELLSLKCWADGHTKEVIIKIMPEYLHYV